MIPGGPFHVAAVQVLLLLPRALVKYGATEASASVSVIHKTSQWLVNIAWSKHSSCHIHRSLMSLLHDTIYIILSRTSLPKCLCEIDTCPPPLSCWCHCTIYLCRPMSFSLFPVGFSLLRFHATILCIIVFSKPLCRVKWTNHLI